MKIIRGDLNDPRVVELIQIHLEAARAQTAPGSAHALDSSGLQSRDVNFWTIWDADQLAGIGALKRLSSEHGEIKSMHTVETMRGRGIARTMLDHLIATARANGLTRISLETGTWDYFAAARALYISHGFGECPPFGDYKLDPNSVFMTLDLK